MWSLGIICFKSLRDVLTWQVFFLKFWYNFVDSFIINSSKVVVYFSAVFVVGKLKYEN